MGTETKMKAIFVIAIVFACLVCEITSLNCCDCSYNEEGFPNCDSAKRVRCSEEKKFCYKQENDWFWSLFESPPGHYLQKGCSMSNECNENGYYWFWGTWVTCCQGDFCNV